MKRIEKLDKLYEQIKKIKLDIIVEALAMSLDANEPADEIKKNWDEMKIIQAFFEFWEFRILLIMDTYNSPDDAETEKGLYNGEYRFESEEDENNHIVSVFRIALGESRFETIKDYLSESYDVNVFEYSDESLYGIVGAANYFDDSKRSDVSEYIMNNLIHLIIQRYFPKNKQTACRLLYYLLYEYLIDSKPTMAAEVFIKYSVEMSHVLDMRLERGLFYLANETGKSDNETARAIFSGILLARRLRMDESCVHIWEPKSRICVCNILLYGRESDVEALAELVNHGISGEVTDVLPEDLAYFEKNILMFASCVLRYSKSAKLVLKHKNILDYYYNKCKDSRYVNNWIGSNYAFDYKGHYHFVRKEYLQAAACYRAGLNCEVSDEHIKLAGNILGHINLINTYWFLHNNSYLIEAQKLYEILYDCADKINNKKFANVICRAIICYIHYASDMNDSLNQIEIIKKLIYKHKKHNNIDPDMNAVITANLISFTLSSGEVNKKNYKIVLDLIEQVEEDNESLGSSGVRSILDKQRIRLYEYENTDEFLQYLLQLYADYKPVTKQFDFADKVGTARKIASLYLSRNETAMAIKYLEEMVEIHTQELSLALRYLDEAKLLAMIENNVSAYEQLLYYASDYPNEYLYNYILKYKALKSYIVEVRNELLRAYPDDKGLLVRIRLINDQINKINTNNTFFDENVSVDSLMQRKEELEAQFESNFPLLNIAPRADINSLKDKLNADQAIIEYVRCNKVYNDDISEMLGRVDYESYAEAIAEKMYEYEVYVVRICDGEPVVNRKRIGSMYLTDNRVFDFLESVIENNNPGLRAEQKVNLYKRLIEPIEEFITDVSELIIAPADGLAAVPFDVLGKNGRDYLIDRYTIRYIECGRDLIKRKAPVDSGDALLMGNPAFDYTKELYKSDGERGFEGELKSLPFSGIEVDKIASRLHCKAIQNIEATKFVLLNSSAHKYIHISTHGDFDREYKKNPIYSSCIYFAGAQNWLNTHIENKRFGNGIVTADEISRLDLHKTELVVLSSCYSGMVDADLSKGAAGLRSSFKAAGVHYVVMSQWQLSDLATAVMMDKFYEYAEHETIPCALQKARLYLRNATVDDLRNSGWLTYKPETDPTVKKQVDNLNNTASFVKPFYDYRYWGSMVCMEC